MWEYLLETARLAVAWERPMSEIESMTPRQLAAMEQAYTEIRRARDRAQRQADRQANRRPR